MFEISRLGLLHVTHVDSGHSVRGSWGDTRALHLTMEDDVRIKMNMVNVHDYLNLQAEEEDNWIFTWLPGQAVWQEPQALEAVVVGD